MNDRKISGSIDGYLYRQGADKIVLVSCNPATLARDLGLLTGTLTEKDGALVKCANPETDYEFKA